MLAPVKQVTFLENGRVAKIGRDPGAELVFPDWPMVSFHQQNVIAVDASEIPRDGQTARRRF